MTMTQQELQEKQENLDKLRVAYDVIRDMLSCKDLHYTDIECFEFVKNYIANEIAYEVTFSPANVKLVANE